MDKLTKKTEVRIETVNILTYPFVEPEVMPLFSETANHQGTSGNPYPVRATSNVVIENPSDKPWTVITLENDYVRIGIMPELGGRVSEAYDKRTGYNFLYRQHVVKPAMIGVYGPWTSGGLEFNWPFHHRPSTFMPVDYYTEYEEDGTAIVWLSEHAPSDRTKGMVGIVLRPDASYFETRAVVTNRTSDRHSFLWWENAAVAVHEDYRLIFPPDVTWVHHHDDASHTTFPMAYGQYGADNITEPKDISWHKNSKLATSYFAGPSEYDFFGGYDYRCECGTLHIANHHTAPGKKMFTWGYGDNAETWQSKLTDEDGAYAELMAGSYTNDQPDFTWLAPYETKCFSQFWYPTKGIGYVTYANIDAAVALDREAGEIRFNSTREFPDAQFTVYGEDGRVLLDKRADITPSSLVAYKLDFPKNEHLTVMVWDKSGKLVLSYTEKTPDSIHIPENRTGIPTPSELKTPMEIVTTAEHIDQYKSPLFKPDEYYLEALRRDPEFLPALKGMGEYYARVGRFEDALTYLNKAWSIECKYNQNPEDGKVGYYKGIALKYLGKYDEAYNTLYRAAWSNNVISAAMCELASIDGIRGDYEVMLDHALIALEKEMRHPLALPYAALAALKLGNKKLAAEYIDRALGYDKLNHLARFVKTLVTGKGINAFYAAMKSSPSQTCLDVAFDLLNAGFAEEAIVLLTKLPKPHSAEAMVRYTLAYAYDMAGDKDSAVKCRKSAPANKIVEAFPIRNGEMLALKAAISANENDAFAKYLLGCQYYNMRKYDDAAKLFEDSIRQDSKFYIPYRNLALLYYNHLARPEEAKELLMKAVELNPNDSLLLSEMAGMLVKLGGNPTEDAEYLTEKSSAKKNDAICIALATAYNKAMMFDEAYELMTTHKFTPAEGEEVLVADPYMYSCLSRGRIAMREHRYEQALALFKEAQVIPDNINVGFWNDSVLIPYKYNEAEALAALGRHDEAAKIIKELAELKDVGMWNMGGEFIYYKALAIKLGGEEARAASIMRNAILGWEKELEAGCKYKRRITRVFASFVGDQSKIYEADLYGMLGYAKLFFGDKEGAKELFCRSIAIVPSFKISFELELLK